MSSEEHSVTYAPQISHSSSFSAQQDTVTHAVPKSVTPPETLYHQNYRSPILDDSYVPILCEPNRPTAKYNFCHALLIVFTSDDLGGCLSEALNLKQELRQEWGFLVTVYKIPFVGPQQRLQETVEKAIAGFRDKHDENSNLLLFYFGCHGAWNTSKEYTLAMSHEGNFYQVRFRPIREYLQKSKSDVAIFLDACYSEGGIYRDFHPHTVEILAACRHNCVTPAVGPESFTNAILRVFREFKGNALSFEQLSRELETLGGPCLTTDPVYHSLEKSCRGSITFRRIGRGDKPDISIADYVLVSKEENIETEAGFVLVEAGTKQGGVLGGDSD